ncbi:MAG: hypothetical protein Q8J85_02885 [Sulfuricurvum sp.]|nr:hypothetical protein [Sulfuricurvum sp.]MDP3023105.1 hypothetical protein [Sulfuricurvum sp.]
MSLKNKLKSVLAISNRIMMSGPISVKVMALTELNKDIDCRL